MTYKKKLIEVALPLARINDEAAREKAVRHGHPSTLHLWWARRPFSSARALIWASLVDDPSSLIDQFPDTESQEIERRRLFDILEKIASWEAGTNPEVMRMAKEELAKSCPDGLPTLIDPFGGGGAIPLEAGRLGMETVTGDINPVAVLIHRGMFDIPRRFAGRSRISPDSDFGIQGSSSLDGMVADFLFFGRMLEDSVKRRVEANYREEDTDDEVPMAWIWASTVKSPDPSWAKDVPLAGSWVVRAKKNKEIIWVNPVVDHANKAISYQVMQSGEPAKGTVVRANGTCVATGTAIPKAYIKTEGLSGELGYQVLCRVVAGKGARQYLNATAYDQALGTKNQSKCWQPEGKMPTHSQYMGPVRYGIDEWHKLFLPRQLSLIDAFVDELNCLRELIFDEALKAGMPDGDSLRDGGNGAKAYSEAIITYLSFTLDRALTRWNSLAVWDSTTEKVSNIFRMQAYQMNWTLAEVYPFSPGSGGWSGQLSMTAEAIRNLPITEVASNQIDAAANIRQQGKVVLSTDPPYYDNIPYSDLSDFFYVIMRKTLGTIWPDEMATLVTPKQQELVADHERHGSKELAKDFFESGMREVFTEAANHADERFPATIYYAYKARESESAGGASTGWETFLQSLIDGGWSIHRTWPVRTEMTNGLKTAKNMLATSVVLVCRRRSAESPIGTTSEFVRRLRTELPEALRILQLENIAPVDLAQSSIGPGMAVFSSFSRVLKSDGQTMSVGEALTHINEILSEILSGEEGEMDAPTRFALTWFDQYGFADGPSYVADTLANAKNTSVEKVCQSGLAASYAGKTRILKREELSDKWDPLADRNLTTWEICQHLIKNLEISENMASQLLKKIGIGLASQARIVAYLLHEISVKNGLDREALAYNTLIVAWPELEKLARQELIGDSSPETLF